jgi:hypothetical protein
MLHFLLLKYKTLRNFRLTVSYCLLTLNTVNPRSTWGHVPRKRRVRLIRVERT